MAEVQHAVAVLVRVLRTRGSTPRETGAWMMVYPDRTEGTIGGGGLELDSIALAREMLPASSGAIERTFVLGGTTDQCCGGAVTVGLVPLDADGVQGWADSVASMRASQPVLLLFGAGHVGRALAYALAPLPLQLVWIDSRPEEFGDTPPPNVVIQADGDWQRHVAGAPPGSGALVLTQSHALDALIVAAALERGDFRYVGLIGSRTKRARFVTAFREIGLTEAQIDTLICPIGARGVRDKRPEMIACLVAAEIAERFIPSPTDHADPGS